MKISEYQSWLKSYDTARGFHHASAGHSLIHLFEELGEISRLILYAEGYRDPEERGDWREQLAEELADAAAFLFKLAYLCDIDLEAALSRNMEKAERRFGIEQGLADTERYLAHQERNLRNHRGKEGF